MERYSVSGMSCAACAARVEKAVLAVPGVTGCSVSLLTNSMSVSGTAGSAAICAAVSEAGYGAAPAGTASAPARKTENEEKQLKTRLISSLILLLPLMTLSMGHMAGMGGVFALPAFNGVLQLLLSSVILLLNRRFFISGYRAVRHGAPNMDTLVALGSGISYLYSLVLLLLACAGREIALHAFTFESAAMIVTLITVGKLLEARAKGKTTDALKSLLRLTPQTATVLRDGEEVRVPAEELRPGDLFVLRPGDRVPADGTVIGGSGAMDESALTGESIPAEKETGSDVSAATVNITGFLTCRANRVGQDTSFSQVVRLVSDAAATKAPIAKTADKVAAVFVPAVLAIAFAVTVIWLAAAGDVANALSHGVAVLVISCPCALGLATPVAIMVGSGVGAKNGILFKTASALEEAGRAGILVLDKTGTVTMGRPAVTDVLAENDSLLPIACALEQGSEHPLGRAIVSYGERNGIVPEKIENFRAKTGSGVTAVLDGETVSGGSLAWMETLLKLPDSAREAAETLSRQGKTPLLFAKGDTYLGIIGLADEVKQDSAEAIRRAKNMGMRVVMVTGDREATARAIAEQVGIEEIRAGVKPAEKAEIVRALRKEGHTVMIGDGVNDAPALVAADLGLAIGAGTDVAIDAADAVLTRSTLRDAVAAVALGRSVLTNIRENLFWAFFYNVIGIPLAAGAFEPLLGVSLPPMFGAAAMSISSFCVVSNALRLNLTKLYDPKKDRKITGKKERKMKEITMNIEGMMCPHCEARVKKALEAVDGVASAVTSFEAGTAVITLTKEVPWAVLEKAVTDQGYEVK